MRYIKMIAPTIPTSWRMHVKTIWQIGAKNGKRMKMKYGLEQHRIYYLKKQERLRQKIFRKGP